MNIITDIQNRINRCPDKVAILLRNYEIYTAPSIENIAKAYQRAGQPFLYDFYRLTIDPDDISSADGTSTTKKTSSATAGTWGMWLNAAGSALSGFGSALFGASNSDQQYALQQQQLQAQAAAERSKTTTTIIIGIIVVIIAAAAIYFIMKKK